MLILVMAMDYVTAKQMLKVTSVTVVLRVTTIFQLAQVGGTNVSVKSEFHKTFFFL